MKNNRKKRIGLKITLGILLGVPLTFALLMFSIGFQTWLFGSIISYFGDKMGGKIQFEQFFISPVSGLKIQKLYIEDDTGDTLLYLNHFYAGIKSLKIFEGKFNLSKVDISDGFYNLYSINEGEQTNMQFIFNFLSSADTLSQDTTKGNFYLSAEQVNIKNIRFRYKCFSPDSVAEGVDFGDIYLSNFNLNGKDFELFNDSIQIRLNQVSLRDWSGFELNHLSGDAIVSPTEISVKQLLTQTPQSHIIANSIGMYYNDWGEMGDFIEKVKIKLDLQLSTVDFADIAFFAPQLSSFNLSVYPKGKITGTISNLKSKDFDLSFGKASHLKTSFSMQGLPEVSETFLSLNIEELELNFDDLEQLIAMQTHSNEAILLPEIKKMKRVRYNGNITGFLNDLVAYGTFENKEGKIETDLRYYYNFEQQHTSISGKIETEQLSLKFLNTNDTLFDRISMNGQVQMSIDSMSHIAGNFNGQVSQVTFNHYSYSDIELDAEYKNDILNSMFKINDTNLIVKLDSKIDFSKTKTIFEVSGQIERAHLSNLNWMTDEDQAVLNLNIEANLNGNNIDEIEGQIGIHNFNFLSRKLNIDSHSLMLTKSSEGLDKHLKIKSDLFDLEVDGDYKLSDLGNHLLQIQKEYIPSLNLAVISNKISPQSFNFDINLKNTYSVFQIFVPSFLPANGTQIIGQYNSKNKKFDLLLRSDSIRINTIFAENIHLKLERSGTGLNNELDINKLNVNDLILFDQLNIYNHIQNDSVETNLTWQDLPHNRPMAEISTQTIFLPSTSDSINLNIGFVPSYLYLEDSIWYINDASILLRGTQADVKQFVLNHDQQYVYIDGKWHQNSNDTLNVILNQIDIDYFPIIDSRTGVDMHGLINGDLVFGYQQSEPWSTGSLRLDSLLINNQDVGLIKMHSNWRPQTNKIEFEVINEQGKKNFRTLEGKGFLDLNRSELKVDLNLNKQKLVIVEPFVHDYISEIDGYVSGQVNVLGPLDKLDYNGTLDFTRGVLKINYLGTKYNFTDQIKFNSHEVSLDQFKLNEFNGRGDIALLSGKMLHENFDKILFDFQIKMKEFMVLNTNLTDNELFYGKAFLTGTTNITGTPENLVIKLIGTTNKNTNFHIPLSSSEEASNSNFINFTNRGVSSNIDQVYKVDLSGIVLDFNLKVTPEADVQLIFDQQMGDIVKANGNGIIQMNINTLGNFTIAGDYTIEKGEYLFTLRNVINKKFKIEQGSTIKWNGDPYEAFLDIKAIYRLKTSIFDLTLNPEDKEKIPVECHLNMSKSLSSPDITFDIKAPSSGDQVKSLINAMDQDEKNKQMLSLLVMGQFSTPDYLKGGEVTGSSNAVGKNASELLSNQLSNWLSQVSDDFDIGVNYRPGDDISSDELEVALSTQLFNDRVAIDGNVGVGTYQNTSNSVVGNVNVDIKINKKGNLRVRGFNRVNDSDVEYNALYTQGVGLYYREDFDSFTELLSKYWKGVSGQNINKTETEKELYD